MKILLTSFCPLRYFVQTIWACFFSSGFLLKRALNTKYSFNNQHYLYVSLLWGYLLTNTSSCMFNSQGLTTNKPSRASTHASLFPPTSINGLTAHYRLQKYTVSVSHLFHLQPSRCVWAPECMAARGWKWVFNAVCGMWSLMTLHLNISHLLANGDDEQVGGESAGNSES